MKKIWCFCILNLLMLAVVHAAEKPFQWQAEVKKLPDGKYQAAAVCKVADKAYLYAENTNILVTFASGASRYVTKSTAVFNSENAGIYPAGTHRWQAEFEHEPVKVEANFQGCTSGGSSGDICLMPETLTLYELNATAAPVAADTAALPAALAEVLNDFPQQKSISGLLNKAELIEFVQNNGNAAVSANNSNTDTDFWAILLLVLLGGLSLNLTPCVLPMIPINLAIIGASGSNVSRWQGFRRGSAYALGITLAYGVLGVLAALTGSSFGALNSSAVFNWVIAGVFAALALGMFGVYELDFTRFGNIFRGKSKIKLPPAISAFLLGIMAALLAGACVAPVVISVVVLAGKLYSEGSVWALTLPFALGFSMALPWPLLGAGMSILPRPGAWMVRIKQFFGVVILLMALYYGYLGIVIFRNNNLQDKAVEILTQELTAADKANEDVLIDCWASWCKNCSAQDKVLHSQEVEDVLKKSNIRLIKFQAEDLNDPTVKAFMQKYSLPGLPSLVLLKKGE